MSVKTIIAAVLACSVVGAAALPAQAQRGPSFNCRKARTWVEKTICRDRVLSDKDRRMASAYNSLLEQSREGGGPDTDLSGFQAEQRAWLRERNRCRTRACINAAYDKRINEVTVDY